MCLVLFKLPPPWGVLGSQEGGLIFVTSFFLMHMFYDQKEQNKCNRYLYCNKYSNSPIHMSFIYITTRGNLKSAYSDQSLAKVMQKR